MEYRIKVDGYIYFTADDIFIFKDGQEVVNAEITPNGSFLRITFEDEIDLEQRNSIQGWRTVDSSEVK